VVSAAFQVGGPKTKALTTEAIKLSTNFSV